MKTISLLLLAAAALLAQDREFNHVRVIPNSAQTTVGEADFATKDNSHYVGLAAPDTMTGNVLFRLPSADGTAGQVMTTDGSGHLSFSAGSLTAPVTISGSISSTILTVTQGGVGNALAVNGITLLNGNLSGSLVTITQSGSGDALDVTGPTNITGSLTASSTVFGTVDGVCNTTLACGTFGQAGTGQGVNIQTAGGTGLYVFSNSGLAAQIQKGAFQIDTTASLVLNGSGSGTHLQNLGTGDSPTFAGITFGSLTVNGVTSINGTTSGTLTTITQSGTGDALGVTGAVNVTGGLTAGNTVFSSVDGVCSTTLACGTFGQAGTGQGANIQTTSGTGLYVFSNSGLAAEIQKGAFQIDSTSSLTLNGTGSGTHLQNLGTGDSPTFSVLTVTSCVGCGVTSFNTRSGPVTLTSSDVTGALGFTPATLTTNTFSGTQTFNGSLTGTHAQNLGTGDSPTFAGITFGSLTVNGNTSGTLATITQSGTGDALDVTGPTNITGSLTAGATVFATVDGACSTTLACGTFGQAGTGQGVNIQTTSGTGLYVFSNSGLSAEIQKGAFQIDSTSSLVLNGSGSGTHLQNLGTGDWPGFLNLSIGSGAAGGTGIYVNSAANSYRVFYLQQAGIAHWAFGGDNTTVSGGPTGSTGDKFFINRNDNSGNYIDTPLVIDRANGTWSGAHIQNLGAGDNPAFAGLSTTGGITATAPGSQFRAVDSNYGVIFHNDDTNFYLLPTFGGTPYGTWSTLRPFAFNLSTGVVSMANGIAVGGGINTDTLGVTGTATFNGTVTGTHAQNLGAGDSPSFSSLGVTTSLSAATLSLVTSTGDSVSVNNIGTGQGANLVTASGTALSVYSATGKAIEVNRGALQVDSAGSITLNGSGSGTHLQNLGTGDSPTFSVITVAGCVGCGGGVTSFNSRTGAVTLSSGDVTGALGFTPATLTTNTFSGTQTFNGSLAGTHAQNIGTGDSVTLNSVSGATYSVSRTVAFGDVVFASNQSTTSGTGIEGDTLASGGQGIYGVTNYSGGVTTGSAGVNGVANYGGVGVKASSSSGTGLYASSGSGLAAEFANGVKFDSSITQSSGQSSTLYIGSGNFYNRTFSGSPSCSGVADGWTGYDTSGDHIWVCSGGVAKAH